MNFRGTHSFHNRWHLIWNLKDKVEFCSLNHTKKREGDILGRENTVSKNKWYGAPLVAQWSRIQLPMQETGAQFLVQEDPTCHEAAKPLPQLLILCSGTHALQQEKPLQ